jgi:raffinose/stachyose/melibiose transport system permease protein
MISRRDVVAGYVLLGVAAVIALLPFVGVLLLSLGDPGNSSASISLSSGLHWSNFADVWSTTGFSSSMATSALITSIVVVVSVALSVPAGYALALTSMPGRRVLLALLIFGLLIPIEAMIIPLYFDLRAFHIADTIWGVVLPEVGFSVAFGAFWMRAFFLGAPRSLVEAARLDGANSLQTLLRVLLPLARPQMLTLAVLFFVWNWNDFLLPLVMLSGSDLQTAPIALVFFQGQHTTNYTYLAAGSLIVIAPVVLLYLLLQRSFTRGMLAGAIKE